MKKGFTLFEVMVVAIMVIILMVSAVGMSGCFNSNVVMQFDTAVLSKHVDYNAEHSSHYMVTTDAGTFEVQNGWWLNVYNADELYGKIVEGKKYHIVTKGVKRVNAFIQQYPYIVQADLIK